ncbi:hypothetical protein U1P98_07510 [Lysinibacillus irui]|uniref:Minor capsid protein n=1 Tax=Lysinibacillus irui TaxID=2998077 RepID=A0ABU5NJC9_9BACI|nr:hypothetical protein [Lysinibacillus irui]MEA0553762.1 hypothetical protein [Lysinibacillus irui]MEA0976146.1 hypothetical protein [Lysinibacillus irui]MEA1042300.1 hypothetical protein [Lysinibacillus irui]
MRVPSFLLKDEARIRLYKGTGVYGPVYNDDPIFTHCYYELVQKKVELPNGAAITSSATAVLPPNVCITIGSEIEINGRKFEVMQVESVNGWTKSCYEVILR